MQTPIYITAGFRKENLPRGAWSVLCQALLWVCKCGQRFAQPFEDKRELVELYGELEDV